MSDRLQWILALEDRLSGPGAKMERQLGRVRAQLKQLDIQAKTSALDKITDPLKRQRAELQLHRDKLMLSKAAMEQHGGATKILGERFKAGREALRDWLLILDPIARGMRFVASRAEEMGKRIVAAVSFKQGAMIGLGGLFGGAGGNDVFESMARMAGRIGKPIEQLVELARSFATVGFKQADIEPMVRLIEDLNSLDPGAGDKLAHILQGVKSNGFATVGDIEAMRGTRISPDKIFEKLGNGNRIAGKTGLEQLNSVGTGILPNAFSQLMLGEIPGLEGGKAGSASGRGGQTLQARIDRVGIQVERMFGRLSGSAGVKAFGRVLDNVINLFNPDSATGARTFAKMEEFSGLLAKAFEPLTGPDGLKRMQDFFTTMAKSVEEVLPGLKAIAGFLGMVAGVGLKSIRGAGYLKDFGGDVAGMVSGTLKKGEETEATRRFLGAFFGDSSLPAGSYQKPTTAQRRDFRNITIHVHAPGASKDDAQHIADTVADVLDRAATQEGAQ